MINTLLTREDDVELLRDEQDLRNTIQQLPTDYNVSKALKHIDCWDSVVDRIRQLRDLYAVALLHI